MGARYAPRVKHPAYASRYKKMTQLPFGYLPLHYNFTQLRVGWGFFFPLFCDLIYVSLMEQAQNAFYND